jgi:hypothetical protein
MSFQPAAPGWYADPQRPGEQRYWDGTQWVGPAAPMVVQQAAVANVRQWAMFAHLSALIGLVVGFNFLGPLIIYLVKRDQDPFLRDQAAEALNFNLSAFIYLVTLSVVTFILIFVLVGLLLLPVIAAAVIAWVAMVVIGGLAANRGEAYRYPLTIRFVT